MVSTNKYLNARQRLFDLSDQIEATDKCNARLMAEIIGLSGEVQKLTKEIKSANQTIVDAGFLMKRLDIERLKQVNEKKNMAQKYTAVCQIISDIDLETSKRYFCDRCKYSDGVVCCNGGDACTFEVR